MNNFFLNPKLSKGTSSPLDLSMYQIWLRYLSRFLCSAPETKRDGRTDGRKDGRTEGRTSAPIPISPCHFVAGDNKDIVRKYDLSGIQQYINQFSKA